MKGLLQIKRRLEQILNQAGSMAAACCSFKIPHSDTTLKGTPRSHDMLSLNGRHELLLLVLNAMKEVHMIMKKTWQKGQSKSRTPG